MKCVHVEWIDSHTETGWGEYSEEPKPDITHTVGLLLAETDHFLIVAHSYDPSTDEWNGRICIPHCSIKNVRTLCQIKI